jgi:uncharacterized DUF497 family protein
MGFEWDLRKAEGNFKKHGVWFAESLPVFQDDLAVTVIDDGSDPGEQRFASIGMGAKGRVPVVVYSYRGERIRVISARPAEVRERSEYVESR